MAILNVTPDSFYAGSRSADAAAVERRAGPARPWGGRGGARGKIRPALASGGTDAVY